MKLSRMMHGGTEPVDFKPPPPGRWSMPMTLAVLVHGALIVALAWGVNWNKETAPVAFDAELWSALPREAAPRAVEPPPPPPPPPAPAPAPEPAPPPPAPTPTVREPDIATQQAKKKAEEDKRAREEAARKAREAEQKRKAEAERKKAEAAKAAADKRRREAQAKAERERREADAARQARDEQMRRIMGQAGATGAPDARGTADRSSGPSAGYAARVAARIRPNIILVKEFPAHLTTEIEVRATPDGRILSRRIVRGSGDSDWDEAALRAIDRTGSLPRDTDGRVPSPLIVGMRPVD